MKKPYIRKLKEIYGIKVFLVDGKYVRTNIEEEFTNYAQHYRFKFIPKDEFWIDRGASPKEQEFYILHMIVEYFLMSKGISFHKALYKANAVEKKERLKYHYISDLKNQHHSQILDRVHVKLLKKYSKKIQVWIVRGELVRDLFFIDFTEGGHHFVYDFVPTNEVWLDDNLTSSEIKYVLLHELYERNLMMTKGMSYSVAHDHASLIEYFCRKHTNKLDEYLDRELKKSEALVKRIPKKVFW